MPYAPKKKDWKFTELFKLVSGKIFPSFKLAADADVCIFIIQKVD
jgi:hypothetical protein